MEITDDESDYGYNKFSDLEDIFSNAARLTAAKEFLTYAKVVNAWKRDGPVAAKLLTWIRNQESSTEEGELGETCFTEYLSVTLHLPGCDKDLRIDTTIFYDHSGDNDGELTIQVTCGDLDIKSEGEFAGCF